MEASAVLPRTNVRTTDQKPTPSVPLDGTRLLIATEAPRGILGPQRFRNPRDLRKLPRTGLGIPVFDAIDVALRERVPEVFFTRVVGPAAAPASINLAGAGGTSLTIELAEVGEWGNGAAGGMTAEVLEGPSVGSDRLVILRLAGEEVARTVAASDRTSLIAALLRIDVVGDVIAGADLGLPSVAAAGNFTGGTSDAGAITTDHVTEALERVSPEWGPMQVVTPGRNSDTANEALLAYANASDRTALLEQADGLSVGAIAASAALLRDLGSGAEGLPRLGGLWAQHATGPGVVPGTTRSVPWPIIVAGLIARLEASEQHPNVAPFGDSGVPLWATGLTSEFTEADAETLFAAGVNIAYTHPVFGVRNRTFRTLEEDGTSEWVDLAHTRTERAVRAIARDVGRSMGSKVITRATVNDFAAKFRLRLDVLRKRGALFGDTPDEAFTVDVDTVNTAETIRAREVNANVGLCMSEHAEFVNVELAKVPIGQEV